MGTIMAKNVIPSGLYILVFLFFLSCNDTSDEPIPITDYFSFKDGYEWTYDAISSGDTSIMFSDFDMSQLSDNKEIALLDIYGIDFNAVLAIKGHSEGICIELLDTSIDETKLNINNLDVECAALLKYPVNSGDDYSYSYQIENRSYNYNVDVSIETITINARTFQVYKYTIPSGAHPERNINEVYFSPEVGLVKLHPEFEMGTVPQNSFTLREVNF